MYHIFCCPNSRSHPSFGASWMNANVLFTLFYSCRRTSLTWRRSSLRTALRIAVTISQTPKAEKTMAGPSLQRAGEDAGYGEVLCTAYISQAAVTYVGCQDRALAIVCTQLALKLIKPTEIQCYRSFSNTWSYGNCKKKQDLFLFTPTVTSLGCDLKCKRPLWLEVAADVQETRQSTVAVASSWTKLACRLQGLTVRTTAGEHCVWYDASQRWVLSLRLCLSSFKTASAQAAGGNLVVYFVAMFASQ